MCSQLLKTVMTKTAMTKTVMTVAGSDSGGGAGIQADLKTFAALGAFGTSALSAVTAQNPSGVTSVEVLSPELIARQIEMIGDYFTVGAIKTGMLASGEMVLAVAEALRGLSNTEKRSIPPIVVDPVMVAASGARLVTEDALKAIEKYLLPLATVITPNLDEAAVLAQRAAPLKNEKDMETTAGVIYQRFGVPVLIKGGHLVDHHQHLRQITNCLFDGNNTHWISHARIAGVNTHGSGCTLSAAIAVHLMRELPLKDSVVNALDYLHGALEHAIVLGGSSNGRDSNDGGEKFINHQFNPQRMG